MTAPVACAVVPAAVSVMQTYDFPSPRHNFIFLKKFEGIDVCGWLKLVTEYNYLSAPRKVYRLALHPQILCTKVSITNNVLDRSEFLF